MKRFTCYHHLRVSDNDTIDFLRFDPKLQFKQNNDRYGNLAGKTAKDNGSSEDYIKRETRGMLKMNFAVLGERDSG